MKRRVIKQGRNTLTITLPMQWNEKHHIHSGSELEVQERGDILMIVPNGQASLPELTVDVRGLTPMLIWRCISSAYRAGYDEFRVLFDSNSEKRPYSAFTYNTIGSLYSENNGKQPTLSPIEVIQLTINRCVGIEIIDQKENSCLIKELSETTYKEFDNALRRIFLLLISIADEINNALLNKDRKEILKGIYIIDTNIDQFTDFCLRVLNKQGYKDARKTPIMHSIIMLLEIIGDEYKKICIHILEEKHITKKIYELCQYPHQQLRKFYTIFYNFNMKSCIEFYATSDSNCNQSMDPDCKKHYYDAATYESLNTEEKEILHHLKKIHMNLMSLMELRINLEY